MTTQLSFPLIFPRLDTPELVNMKLWGDLAAMTNADHIGLQTMARCWGDAVFRATHARYDTVWADAERDTLDKVAVMQQHARALCNRFRALRAEIAEEE